MCFHDRKDVCPVLAREINAHGDARCLLASSVETWRESIPESITADCRYLCRHKACCRRSHAPRLRGGQRNVAEHFNFSVERDVADFRMIS